MNYRILLDSRVIHNIDLGKSLMALLGHNIVLDNMEDNKLLRQLSVVANSKNELHEYSVSPLLV